VQDFKLNELITLWQCFNNGHTSKPCSECLSWNCKKINIYLSKMHTKWPSRGRLLLGRLLFGQLVWRKIFFFQFFLLDEWTTYFTSFLWTPSMSNFDSVWARGKVLLKMGIKIIFPVFFEDLLHVAMWLKLHKGWRARCLKKVCSAHRILVFYIFLHFFIAHGFAWCHL
jgi:hypothetical protein